MSALRVENAYKVFGRRGPEAVRRLEAGASRDDVAPLGTAAVIDASFEVQPGEIFVVMGLSGSGKSTLIRMLNGLLRPTAGHIHLGDDDLATVSPARLRAIRSKRVSMVFQHFALLPHRTVLDNAAYPLQVQGVGRAERRERAAESLAMVGLQGWESKLPSQLSGGMRQRVGLARALTADTDILLMDEAFSALDPLIRRDMQEQLIELQQHLGKTVVFITHDLNEAMHLGDRIAVMRAGRIVQIGSAEEILSAPADDYVARFIADVDRTRVLQASSLMRRPAVVLPVSAGPRRALHELREAQVPVGFVVDRDRTYLGMVRDSAVLEAQGAGATNLAQVPHDGPDPVSEDASLSELFAPAAGTQLPLPVIDSDSRLVGVVPRVSILEAMSPNEHTPDTPAELDQPPAEEPGDDDPALTGGGVR